MRFSLRKKNMVVVWVLVLVLAIFVLNVFQKEVKSFFLFNIFSCFSVCGLSSHQSLQTSGSEGKIKEDN